LAIATHPLGWLLPVILFGWLLYDFGVTRRWRPLLIGGGGLIIAVGLLHGGFHIDVRDLLHRGQWNPTQFWPYFNFLLANYWLPLLLTGLGWWLADTPTRRHLNYLLTPLLIYLLALAWGGDTIAYRYLLPAASLLYVSGGAGAALLLAKLPHRLVRLTIGLAITGLFFAGGGGQPYPQTFYTLEHDVGPALAYAHYTPQANWNQAYAYIEIHRRPGDIVISSEPQFNKIFLHEAGYYLRYLYREGPAVPVDDQHREYYVGAKTISHARELNRILNQHSGFLVLDTLAVENHLPTDVAELIKSRMRLVYVSEGNAYSRVWVYERAD
jgi:hypothetical protein